MRFMLICPVFKAKLILLKKIAKWNLAFASNYAIISLTSTTYFTTSGTVTPQQVLDPGERLYINIIYPYGS